MQKKQKGFQVKEKEHFDELSRQTGETWWGSTTPAGIVRLRRRAERILGRLAGLLDPSILDLGCGTGALSKYLLEARPALRLTGCDISPNTIKIANERYAGKFPNARFEVADAVHLPYPADTFDAVVGNSILHHLPHIESLRECFRVLKPGGVIVFSEPNMLNPQIAIEKNVRLVGIYLEDSEDETAFFRWPLARELREIGFSEIAVESFDFLHPATPKPFIDIVSTVGKVIEQLPVIKEISGSLWICAKK